MAFGVFYREFTKLNRFSGRTALAVCHVHLFALGTMLILLIGILTLNSDLEEQKQFKLFWRLYNFALPLMTVMFAVRGVCDVLNVNLSRGASASISGVAGIFHILMAAALVLLFLALGKAAFLKR